MNWKAVLAGGLFATILMMPRSTMAQRAPFAIPDPDPEVERKSFIVADGFEVNLFAADPILAKPLQMNFDPAGRLWVASSEVYPQIKPGQTADDKVLILEDRDGDGKSDHTSVFAQGLLIPTGIEPGDGGAYVANSTELLHFKDTDGDGKADQTRVVLSGFGTEDTHHILHTLRWGFDGHLDFNQSIYIHSHIETPYGVRRLGGGGIWQFRPETMRLEVFIRGLVNPWGHHFDRWGQSFATDGAGGEGINYCLPGAYYTTAPDAVRILQGLNPGSPKDCGLEVLSGRHLPESWRGNLLTNDFRGNRVCRFVISDDGAGFASREQAELIKTRHVAFRPIDVKMGPDGAIYIADWYNPIIQHGEVDFRDPRRDHTRGRIWRVTAKGRPLVPRPRLVGAKTEELLDALKAPEDWTRQQAKRVLKERGAKEVVPKLAEWIKRIDPNDPEAVHQRLEGLWTYQSLDVVEPALLAESLQSGDPRVRAAATRIVPWWKDRLSDPIAPLAPGVDDENPRVRLETVRALALVPSLKSADLAMRALDKPVDRFLDYALWLTARQLHSFWLPEVQAGRFDFGGNAGRLVYALQAVDTPAVVKPLLVEMEAGRIPEAQGGAVQTMIAKLGDANDLGVVFKLLMKDGAIPASRRAALVDTLAGAARDRKVVPAGDLDAIQAFLNSEDPALRAAAVRAIGAWKIESLRPRLLELAGGVDTPREARASALDGLIQLGGEESRKRVEELAEKGKTARIQSQALAALATIDPEGAARNFASWLGRLAPGDYPEAKTVLARFLERKEGPDRLGEALATAKLPADLAKLMLSAIRGSGRDLPTLAGHLTKAGGLEAAPRALTPEEMSGLMGDVARIGDPARGEALFRRKDLTCLKCHGIAGAGGQVGPSLESIGASAPVDYLIDSLLQPNKTVKENYHSVIVATDDGKLHTGIKTRQTDSELVLRDAEDREVPIPLSTIEEQKPAGSLMPAGLTETLTRNELVDLIRFLSELGKVGPYSVGKERIFRRWQALAMTPANRTAVVRTSLDAVAQSGDSLQWEPIYAMVGGAVPLAELPEIPRGRNAPPISIIRAQIDVSSAGKLEIDFNSVQGLTIWIDGVRSEPGPTRPDVLPVELTPGRHTLFIAFERSRRKADIRCAIEELPDSPARAQPVVGK
jgi:putative heme-binding domain-containing protein